MTNETQTTKTEAARETAYTNIRTSPDGRYTGIIDAMGMEGIVPYTIKDANFAAIRAAANAHRGAMGYIVKPTAAQLRLIDAAISKQLWKKAASLIMNSNGVTEIAFTIGEAPARAQSAAIDEAPTDEEIQAQLAHKKVPVKAIELDAVKREGASV